MTTDPQPNLARLGHALEPFAQGDLVGLFRDEGAVQAIHSALEEIAAPDLVTLMIGADRGLTGTFHGIHGFTEAWLDYTETFERLDSEITELVEVGPDTVYSETHQTGTTARGGVELDYRPAAIFRFADGRLEQIEFHLDRAAARRAAGLEPGHPSGG